jgi:hypothetical protein
MTNNNLKMALGYSPILIGIAGGYAISKKYNKNTLVGMIIGLGVGFTATIILAFNTQKNHGSVQTPVQTPVGGTTMVAPSV